MAAYDPRSPRPNPELRDILRAFDKNYREFMVARSHNQRRGYIAVMKALLDQYLDEPEVLTDLLAGRAEVEKARLTPEQLRWDRELGPVDPFAEAELGEQRYFFYTSGGRYSNLYGEPAQDPYYVPGLWNHGPFVYTLEKLYASQQETTHRVAGEEVYQRLVKRSQGPDRPFWVLADPAGIEGGYRVMLVNAYKSESPARKMVDHLSAKLEIRMLMARVVASHCTR